MKDCIFCKIISNQAPAYKIYEDATTLAFLDKTPFTNGHTLVIPKKHYRDILDIPNVDLSGIILTAKRLAISYKTLLQADGFNVRQSSGKTAHQDVFHYHLHLVPRYKDDGLELRAFGEAKKLSNVSSVYERLNGLERRQNN